MNSHFRRLFDLKNHNDDVEDLALSFTVGSNELAESKVIVKLTIVVFKFSFTLEGAQRRFTFRSFSGFTKKMFYFYKKF